MSLMAETGQRSSLGTKKGGWVNYSRQPPDSAHYTMISTENCCVAALPLCLLSVTVPRSVALYPYFTNKDMSPDRVSDGHTREQAPAFPPAQRLLSESYSQQAQLPSSDSSEPSVRRGALWPFLPTPFSSSPQGTSNGLGSIDDIETGTVSALARGTPQGLP